MRWREGMKSRQAALFRKSAPKFFGLTVPVERPVAQRNKSFLVLFFKKRTAFFLTGGFS
jgi:hypothetical protein